MLNCYFVLLYSDFLSDVEARYQVGWVNVGFLTLMILINAVVIISSHLYSMIRAIRLRVIKAANIKKAKANLAEK